MLVYYQYSLGFCLWKGLLVYLWYFLLYLIFGDVLIILVLLTILILHSLILGIVEKISFNNFSIGIGGGILLPISGLGNSSNGINDNTSLVMPQKKKLSFYDIKKLFITPVSPYIKIIFEYAFNPFKADNSEIGFMLGLYINYNFGMKYDVSVLNKNTFKSPLAISFNDIYKKYDYSNLDFGISFGVFFKPLF